MKQNMSAVDCAYNYLEECAEPKRFFDIWEHIVKTLEIENPDDRISEFYTNLTLDGRFATVGENVWTLFSRLTLEERKERLSIDLYGDEDNYDSGEDDEENEENEDSDYSESNEESL